MSSISSIGSATGYLQAAATPPQRPSPMRDLEDAINSGDLATAQQIYQQLAAKAPQNSSAQASQVGQAFSAIGSALAGGDVKGAQSAFAAFKSDVQSVAKGHHHHRHSAPPATDGSASTGLTLAPPSDTSGNNINTAV